jgi:hypothetical protein
MVLSALQQRIARHFESFVIAIVSALIAPQPLPRPFFWNTGFGDAGDAPPPARVSVPVATALFIVRQMRVAETSDSIGQFVPQSGQQTAQT